MGFFTMPLFKTKPKTSGDTAMSGRMNITRGISVGEFLAIVIVVGFLVSHLYATVRARDGIVTSEEIELNKQYAWVVVSVVSGLALNGAMGRFTSSSYSSYGYQPYMPGIPQPGVPGQPQQPPYQDYGHGVMTTMAGPVADSEQDEDARNVEEE